MNYFNYNKVISYGVPVNILIGSRGCGKSYGAKKYVINKFLKNKSEFLYLRRYDNELKSVFSRSNYFDDISNEYKDHELKAKDRKFYIDDVVFGYAKRMTEAQDIKSSNFDNVKTIIIDEYFIEKTKGRYYLKNEGMILLGIFDSIIRNRSDVTIFILGNSTEDLEYSPLFSFFNLSLPFGKDIKLFKENTILVNYINNSDFQKQRENTLIGKLAKGTKYEDYAIHNKIINRNKDFLEHKSGTAKFVFALKYNNSIFGVWCDYLLGKMYVSQDYIKNTPYIFSLTLQDHTPNTMMYNAIKNYNFFKTFITNFKLGNVYFENQKLKHDVYEILKELHNI